METGHVKKRLLEDNFDISPSGLQFCFDRELFLREEFNVDKFVVRQKKVVPLELLRDDLMQYFNILKNSLVELINQDYADFVNLSTNLVGLDKVIGTIQIPIEKMKSDVEVVRGKIAESLEEINLRKNAIKCLRAKRELIHSIESVQRCVLRLERWLKINPTSNDCGIDTETLDVSDMENDPHEDVGQKLERVGNEFSKLEYFTRKCLQHSLIEIYKPRILIVTSELQSQLERYFIDNLKSSNKKAVQQALRTYLGINKIAIAEQLYREEIVRPKLEKLMKSKKNIEHDISALYSSFISFIDGLLDDLQSMMSDESKGYQLLKDFNFLVNSVFPEISLLLINGYPHLFSPANPDLFHQRMTSTVTFLYDLEERCLNKNQIEYLRNCKHYQDFMNKWSVAVYFQIRYQEISTKIDEQSVFEVNIPYSHNSIYFLSLISCVHNSIIKCWQDGIYLDSLRHRFWKLTLQLLNFLAKSIDVIDWNNLRQCSDELTMIKNVKALLLVDLYKFLRINSMKPITRAENAGLVWIYVECVKPKLSESISDDEHLNIKDVLIDCTNTIIEKMKMISQSLQTSLTDQCCQPMKSVFDIPRQYRRTNKPWPTQPSSYISQIFQPLFKFINAHKDEWSVGDLKFEILRKCIIDLTVNFQEQVRDLLSNVKKLEDSLKRLKETRGLQKQNVDKNIGASDDDKIRNQVIIDVKEFKIKSLEILNLSKESIPELDDLLNIVTDTVNSQDN